MKILPLFLFFSLFAVTHAAPVVKSDLLLLEDGKKIRIRAVAPQGYVGQGLQWLFQITSETGADFGTLPPWPCGDGKLNCIAELPELPERERFFLHLKLADENKTVCLEKRIPFATPPKAHWRAFKEGIPDGRVPPPWTALELQNGTVKLWGRCYRFRDAPLPAEILSRGQRLLSRPMKLILDPAPTLWRRTSAKKVNDALVEFHWVGNAGSCVYKARTQIWFDGVIRLDLTVPGGKKVSRYTVEMPCRADLLTYVHRGPWQFGGIRTGYPMPRKAEQHPYRNVFCLQNEELGLLWFDGMPFNWKLKHPEQTLELIPGKKSNLLRIHYIDAPGDYPADRVFTAGFQALPVRPMPEKCPEMRMSYSVIYSDEDPARSPAWTSPMEYDARGNFLPAAGSVELFVKPAPETQGKILRGETFFRTTHGRYYSLNFGYDTKDGVFLQIYERQQTKIHLKSGCNLPADRWTHVAFTWGNAIRLFVNGKCAAQQPWKGSTAVMPVLLHAGGRCFSVDSLRVSSAPRETFDPDNPPGTDERTLLLDHFDRQGYVNGRRATIPEKISDHAEAGYFTPDGGSAEGFRGTALAPMPGPPRSMIEGYAMLGAKALMFHASQYTDEACAGMYIHNPDAFRKTVKAIHDNGMKALVYINNSISNRDRLWDTHREDWLITPKGPPFTSAEHPGDQSYQACPRSEYIDYFFWRLAENMDRFRIDGAFLDGRMYSSCDNALHGCGTVNFEGERVPQRDVWDGRRKAWRLYNILNARGAYGEQHKSSLWDAPTCFFWHGIWEGEQFMNLKLAGKKRLDILPLQAFRMLLNGFAYGMPTRFCAYLDQPFSAVENCTFAFVHGTTWTQTYRINEMQVISPYWKALEEFGAGYHDFRPYWSKTPPALATPDELVKVSAYVRKGKTLLIVANFREDSKIVKGEITLNKHLLGLGDMQVRDAFSGAAVPLSGDGRFPVSIGSFRQAWFLIEEK